jgi:hypothetical protein
MADDVMCARRDGRWAGRGDDKDLATIASRSRDHPADPSVGEQDGTLCE